MMVPAFALMLAAAWWCTGFIQADEHFQVLEFAGARLGLSRYSDLPWEYAARARSWLLPAIAAMLRRGMIGAGHDDPFVAAFLLRAMSGALYLAAVWRFARATTRWFTSRTQWRVAVAIGLGVWFVPVVAARFSADSWSGSLFFLGFATLVRLNDGETCGAWEIFLAGIAFGLAFVTRFQVLLLDAGAVAWLLWSGAGSRRVWSLLVAGGLVALAAGAAIDAWGYGAISFPLWNYYLAQFPGGVLAKYAFEPQWWWYVPAVIWKAGWPAGVALVAGFAGLCVHRRVPALLWVMVPFVLFHSFITHKEVRFFFPMLVAVPYVIVLGLGTWWPAAFVARHAVATRIAAALLIAANTAAFAARLWMPMEPRVAVQETIYRSDLRTVIAVGASDPYDWWGLRTNWYRPSGLRYLQVSEAAPARVLAASLHGALVVTRFPERPDTDDRRCRLLHASAPATIGPALRTLLAGFIPPGDQEPGWWFVARCDAEHP
jgi:GPI mannosyltransferase 3